MPVPGFWLAIPGCYPADTALFAPYPQGVGRGCRDAEASIITLCRTGGTVCDATPCLRRIAARNGSRLF